MGQGIDIQVGWVETEGDKLYYEVRGEGVPLLLIPGGGGDGDHYLPIADILSAEYKVITYDRRANSRSTMNFPHDFDVKQQSRDAAAVIHAVGERSAFVFGNSSGAVIALDMAATQPESVRAVVVHEAPLPCFLEEAEKWKQFFESCYYIAHRFGSSLGATKFFFGIEMPAVQLIKAELRANKYAGKEQNSSDESRISSKAATDILIKNELLPITGYFPDIKKIKGNGVKVYIAIGEYGQRRNTWYARASAIMAEQLNCEMVVFYGHHGSYMDHPEEWLPALKQLLDKGSSK